MTQPKITASQHAAVLFTATQAHEADKQCGVDLPNGTKATAHKVALIVKETIETIQSTSAMAPLNQNPEPKEGELWWVSDKEHLGDDPIVIEWWSQSKHYYTHIARILTPDEIAAMQANIDRLKIDWQAAIDLSERQMNEKYMACVENHRQREIIAELMAQVKKAIELLTPAVEAHLLGELVLPPMIAALTRAKEAGQ